MSKRLLILGAGTAGTIMANRLVRTLPAGWTVTVVDRDDAHIYQPGLLFVPFGLYSADSIVRPRRDFLPPEAERVLGEVAHIDVDQRRVVLDDGQSLGWDLLVVATGARVAHEALPGLTGAGWHARQTDFYSLDGAVAARAALETLERGRLLVHLHELPIKCPVAPLEFAFLAEAWLSERGRRGDVSVTFVTPLDGAFTKPVASRVLGSMLEQRGIEVVADFAAERVDGEAGQLVSYDGRSLDYDLLVSTPLHKGDAAVERSGLGDHLGFLPTDPHTLQARVHPDVFALGDCTDLPTSKAGSVAHFQAEVLADNILRHLGGLPALPEFDGHANCFIETGHGKAVLIDFNYDTEPLPGRYPLPGVGPFTLLGESHANHWGKLGFRWMYWSQLLRGQELPIGHRMTAAGKWERMMSSLNEDPAGADTRGLEARLDALELGLAQAQASLDELVAHSRAQRELVDEVRPVARAMMDAGTERLGGLEARGYFAFGRAGLGLVDRVVEGFGPDDVAALGDSLVAILDTVRALTQPELLALVQEGADALEDAEQAPPVGLVGLARASGDVNVQKGLGIAVTALRQVGRASRVLAKKSRKLRRSTGAPPVHGTPLMPASAAPAPAAFPLGVPSTAPARAPFPEIAGVTFDAEGFVVDADQWTEDLAVVLATDLGVAPLCERKWLAVRTARRLFAESGQSPNIRRLTTASDLDTRELYTLFPRAPGKTVARVAGLPKPVGCI